MSRYYAFFCEFRGIPRIYLNFAAPRPREISEALPYVLYMYPHLFSLFVCLF